MIKNTDTIGHERKGKAAMKIQTLIIVVLLSGLVGMVLRMFIFGQYNSRVPCGNCKPTCSGIYETHSGLLVATMINYRIVTLAFYLMAGYLCSCFSGLQEQGRIKLRSDQKA